MGKRVLFPFFPFIYSKIIKMKKSIILLLILFLISISVEAQQPIPITSLARSSNPLMTIQTNANRYQSYQYFTTAWGDTLLNFMQANPNWLGTYLPAGAVNIAAAGNNLQFTQGGTFRWTSDTTSLGEWIPQFTVSPLLSGGLINQRLIGVGSLADKYIGTSGQDNIGLYVDGYPDIYLRNSQIQDTSLAPGNYYTRVDEEGKVEFVPSDSIKNIGNSDLTQSTSIRSLLIPTNGSLRLNRANDLGSIRFGQSGFDQYYTNANVNFASQNVYFRSIGTVSSPSNLTVATKGREDAHLFYLNGAYRNGHSWITALDSISGSTAFGVTRINATGSGSDIIRLYTSKNGWAGLINLTGYSSSLETTGTPTNILSTNSNGDLGVKQLSNVFSALSAQNTGDQILTTAVNNTFIFDNISFTSGGNITLTADTLINFLAVGVYEVSLDGRFESSASPEPTAVQFVQQGVGIADLGANFLFSITTDDQITPFKRIFEVTALPAAIYIINEATTWASGSVLFSATSSLNVKRLY